MKAITFSIIMLSAAACFAGVYASDQLPPPPVRASGPADACAPPVYMPMQHIPAPPPCSPVMTVQAPSPCSPAMTATCERQATAQREHHTPLRSMMERGREKLQTATEAMHEKRAARKSHRGRSQTGCVTESSACGPVMRVPQPTACEPAACH